jgi:hypothetical protein
MPFFSFLPSESEPQPADHELFVFCYSPRALLTIATKGLYLSPSNKLKKRKCEEFRLSLELKDKRLQRGNTSTEKIAIQRANQKEAKKIEQYTTEGSR